MPARYTTLFYLKNAVKSDGTQLLVLRVSLQTGGAKKPDGSYLPSKRVVYATGLSIRAKQWDAKKQRARPVYPQAVTFNAELDRLRNLVADTFARAETNGKEPEKALLAALKGTKTQTGFLNYIAEFIESRKATDKAGSIIAYATCLKDLAEFERQLNVRLEFETINADFGEKFAAFLMIKGNGNNTVQKKLSYVKTFANAALKNELHNSLAFKQIKDSDFEAETSHVALTRNEISSLINLQTETERLIKVRDGFLFMVFTGVRYSDYLQLETLHLQTQPNGARYLSFTIQKTSKPISIGLNRFALEIWDKYGGQLPKITNQKFNIYLKELCKLAKIDAPTESVTFRGSERITTVQPKYDLISAHTARRTFASLSDEIGISLTNIQKTLGHHDTAQTEIYLKRTALERAAETVIITLNVENVVLSTLAIKELQTQPKNFHQNRLV